MDPITTQCPRGMVPSHLPIPRDITYAVIPGQSKSTWMTNCCRPNPVNLVDGCWEW